MKIKRENTKGKGKSTTGSKNDGKDLEKPEEQANDPNEQQQTSERTKSVIKCLCPNKL